MENLLTSLATRTRLGRLLLHQLFKDIPTFQQVQGSLKLHVVVDTVVTRGCGRWDLLFLLFVYRVLLLDWESVVDSIRWPGRFSSRNPERFFSSTFASCGGVLSTTISGTIPIA